MPCVLLSLKFFPRSSGVCPLPLVPAPYAHTFSLLVCDRVMQSDDTRYPLPPRAACLVSVRQPQGQSLSLGGIREETPCVVQCLTLGHTRSYGVQHVVLGVMDNVAHGFFIPLGGGMVNTKVLPTYACLIPYIGFDDDSTFGTGSLGKDTGTVFGVRRRKPVPTS